MPKFPESLASVERVHIAIWNAASPKNKKEKVMTNLKPEERAREWIDRKLEEVGWKVINRDEYAPGMTAVAVREVAMCGGCGGIAGQPYFAPRFLRSHHH